MAKSRERSLPQPLLPPTPVAPIAQTAVKDTRTWTEKWGAAHNERRKEHYRNDPNYREAWLARARLTYRRNREVALFTCLDRIASAEAYGAPRTVTINENIFVDRVCFTMGELADVLGDHKAPVVNRWRARDILPPPLATAQVWVVSDGRSGSYWQAQPVYLLEETVAMMGAIGEHQRTLCYLRTTHTETIEKIWAAVAAVRKAL